MSEKVIINKPDMVELANEIRSKAGKTNSMNLKQLKNAVSGITGGEDVSAEVGAYTTELAELSSAVSALEQELQGKAAGGSGGGSIDTCTVEIILYNDAYLTEYGYSYLSEDGKIVTEYVETNRANTINSTLTFENVICGSYMYIYSSGPSCSYNSWNVLRLSSDTWIHFTAPTVANSAGTLSVNGDD